MTSLTTKWRETSWLEWKLLTMNMLKFMPTSPRQTFADTSIFFRINSVLEELEVVIYGHVLHTYFLTSICLFLFSLSNLFHRNNLTFLFYFSFVSTRFTGASSSGGEPTGVTSLFVLILFGLLFYFPFLISYWCFLFLWTGPTDKDIELQKIILEQEQTKLRQTELMAKIKGTLILFAVKLFKSFAK